MTDIENIDEKAEKRRHSTQMRFPVTCVVSLIQGRPHLESFQCTFSFAVITMYFMAACFLLWNLLASRGVPKTPVQMRPGTRTALLMRGIRWARPYLGLLRAQSGHVMHNRAAQCCVRQRLVLGNFLR